MTKKQLENKFPECQFDRQNGCYALACYTKEKCNSRDEHGNPMYVPLEIIKEEKYNQNN